MIVASMPKARAIYQVAKVMFTADPLGFISRVDVCKFRASVTVITHWLGSVS